MNTRPAASTQTPVADRGLRQIRMLMCAFLAVLTLGTAVTMSEASPVQAAPNTALCYNWSGTLRQSTAYQGEPVKALQRALNWLNPASLTVDGYFGAGTDSAVRTFQSRNGLTVDGIAGTNTFNKLRSQLGCTATVACPTSGAPIGDTVLLSGNIRVHKCIQTKTQNMINAARNAGITLSANSSWRDPQQQINLRRQNCGPTYYDIYQKPSGQCTPPTAIPGTSRHERGLAIDFANASTSGTSTFVWLRNNAATYGFYNLPSETWHWSVDGH